MKHIMFALVALLLAALTGARANATSKLLPTHNFHP
jgi:hypothetical protein